MNVHGRNEMSGKIRGELSQKIEEGLGILLKLRQTQ